MNSASVAPLNTALVQSKGCEPRGISGKRPLSASASKPKGTLSQYSQCHEPRPRIKPPIDGPAACDVEEITLWIPIAIPSIATGKLKREIGWDDARIAAAPMPWNVRAVTSTGRLCAVAQNTDAITRIATPTR